MRFFVLIVFDFIISKLPLSLKERIKLYSDKKMMKWEGMHAVTPGWASTQVSELNYHLVGLHPLLYALILLKLYLLSNPYSQMQSLRLDSPYPLRACQPLSVWAPLYKPG